ncbi:MAG: hypothetical protein JWQ74_1462 [Marmoricola sp.]|nr:hypothetical protein [Marmoricola sp.]
MTDVRTRAAALVAALVAVVLALVWVLWPDATPTPKAVAAPAPQTVEPGTTLKATGACTKPATKPFKPTTISIKDVAHKAPMIGLPRDGNRVPRPPAISSLGKTQYAWDDADLTPPSGFDSAKPPGAVPGSERGNVLINAHTWPDGSALGNRMLANLEIGDRIILDGGTSQLCYSVTKRIVIKAEDGSAEYYEQDGPPQLALIVCSPPRLGPGNWQNRTIWFASPITGTDSAGSAVS